jgi:MEDS: MEthanogen/methylotroph, DcmR Sensory domain
VLVGDVFWGSHFYLFYETKEDLLDTLVPYFKAGLESGEFCVWAAYKPLTVGELKRALRRSVTDFDSYSNNNSMEFSLPASFTSMAARNWN